MTEDEFLRKAEAFLAERITDVPGPAVELIDSGVLDSLTILEFYLFLEECHGSPIPAEEASLNDIATLHDAYALLRRLSDAMVDRARGPDVRWTHR